LTGGADSRGPTPTESYTDPRCAAVYDPLNPMTEADDFYIRLAGEVPIGILDMGCGTGALAVALARRGHRVTGADPSGSGMLEVARSRPGHELVRWVDATAAGLDLGTRFDLIIMTGHVFQVFLSDADVLAALTNLRRHLATGGRLAFEMRNRARRSWEGWTPENTRERVEVPGIGGVDVHYALRRVEEPYVTFETHFRFAPGDTVVTLNTLRFMDHPEMAALVARAGFTTIEWLGDWDGSPFHPDSREIIAIASG
jgi:SAM-dependent methyltransferase